MMADNLVKIDLAKFIQQVLPQLPDSKEREIFLHWLDRSTKKKLIVEIDLDAAQPQEPSGEIFCPRCGYETILIKGNCANCHTCGLNWTVKP
jgi:hypothetical protein